MPSHVEQPLRRSRSDPACGRLIILSGLGDRARTIFDPTNVSEWERERFVSINFPSMPDVIELARSADYAVLSSQAFPDGIHQYRSTSPLEIPVSFKLSAHDSEYCPKGAYTLLQLASVLQSLTLPFGPEGSPLTVSRNLVDGTDSQSMAARANGERKLEYSLASNDIYPPAVCYLELIMTDNSGPGVACVGYVKSVSAKLMGPFLRGQGLAKNLPSAGDFSFTFVHYPGYQNAFTLDQRLAQTTEAQAFADTVRRQLYNTRHLLNQGTPYHGPTGN